MDVKKWSVAWFFAAPFTALCLFVCGQLESVSDVDVTCEKAEKNVSDSSEQT